MLPDVSAEELLRGFHELRIKQGTKILVYSAHPRDAIDANPDLRARLEGLGADGFMDKTQGLKALTKRVYEMLGFQVNTAILRARPLISPK